MCSLVSLLYVLCYRLVLLDIEEMFTGAAILGEILYQSALALLASYVFFLVNIHYPRENRRIKLLRFIWNHVFRLRELASGITRAVQDQSETDYISLNSFVGFNDAAGRIPFSNSVSVCFSGHQSISFADWHEFLVFLQQRTQDIARDLLLIGDALDEDMIGTISIAQDASAKMVVLSSPRNLCLNYIATFLYEYITTCNGLLEGCRRLQIGYKHDLRLPPYWSFLARAESSPPTAASS
ncbi:MAG: hypothetical protein HS115_06935 [Spirochaetales bacterium]|nr:hypothetical protein [Spirochaetales bacterium]